MHSVVTKHTTADGELWPLLYDPLTSYLSSSSTDHTGHLILAQKGYWNMQLWTWGIACCISNIRLGCLYTAKIRICISCHWNEIHFVQYRICSVVFFFFSFGTFSHVAFIKAPPTSTYPPIFHPILPSKCSVKRNGDIVLYPD